MSGQGVGSLLSIRMQVLGTISVYRQPTASSFRLHLDYYQIYKHVLLLSASQAQ